MDIFITERVQNTLVEKRQNLAAWLQVAPEEEKQACLGCDSDECVQPHLQVIEASLGKIEAKTFGVCQECQGTIEQQVLELDYTTQVCLGCMSSEQKHLLELELAQSQLVQRALLPQAAPSIPGLELAVFSRPAQILGGDYFDFFQYRDGAHGLTIADAMGHGLSASLLMTNLQAIFRMLAPEYDAPVDVMLRLNRFYLHNIHFTTFASAFLARFDLLSHQLVYCNAGHNPPLHYCAATGAVSWLLPTGPAVGVIEDYHIQTEGCPLSDGDMLLFYTDGVTEAENAAGEVFGGQRLAALVQQNPGLPAQELVWAVRQALHGFTDGRPLADDITIMAGRVGW